MAEVGYNKLNFTNISVSNAIRKLKIDLIFDFMIFISSVITRKLYALSNLIHHYNVVFLFHSFLVLTVPKYLVLIK